MKKHLYLIITLWLLSFSQVQAQNADQQYYNSLVLRYHYKAASFVVDTPVSTTSPQQAFLLWSSNVLADSTRSALSLDQFDAAGNFLQERVVPEPGRTLPYLLPKKIIRIKNGIGYYLLGYVIQSPNPTGGINVYSTPVVIRLNPSLSPFWIQKLHFATVTTANANTLIEYNDIIEAANGEIILAGRFSGAPAGQQQVVIVTRLKNSGAIIWNYIYPPNQPCNANALSLTEAVDGNIILTGYIENCTPPGFAGPQRTLFMSLQPTGLPITGFAYTGVPQSAGRKIVKRTFTAGNDAFFITGYIDVQLPTGAINRQIQVLDVRENGSIVSLFHVGDGGQEEANDLVIRDLGNQSYYLYLTGYTTSYYTQVAREVYFAWLRYIPGNLSLMQFNTYPQTANYTTRTGVEIKAAGKDRFAILANADYILQPAAPLSTFSNVLIRDLQVSTTECIKLHQPPITPYQYSPQQLGITPSAPLFKQYPENWSQLLRVLPKLLCGQFRVDARGALNSNIIEKVTPVADNAAKDAQRKDSKVKVYPNPATSQVFVEFTQPVKEKVLIRVFGADMRLLRQQEASDNSRKAVSLDGLPAGLYFIQVGTRSHQEIFKIRKD
ncbi:T9SS type A sorting domain-containing protein [Chitinophaga solisilvae]|uniref:T9SS type A sorting domain-containing protein n=1 Tax=Chitinophaga solisilvae TaxID=1233460 RepID=UPI00136D1467|nr:T9SS type A sorting domain-containing protein [Chitinophaga solisilvae]